MVKKINQVKMGAVISYLQMALSVVIGLLYTPFMIRYLGKSEYGLYNTVSSVISMLSILSLGFNAGYIRYYSKYKKEENNDKIYKLNGLFLIIFTIIGIIALICGTVISFNLNIVFDKGLTSEEYEIARVLMLLLTANLAISFPMSVFQSIISAHEKYIFLKLLAIFKTVGGPLVTLPLLLAGFRSIAMVVVTVGVSLVIDISYFFFVIFKLKQKFIFRDFEKGLFKSLFAFTFFIALNIFIDQINWNVDKFLLGRFKGTSAVGVYSVGFTLYQYYQLFSTSISGVFTPRIHKIVNATEESNLKNELSPLFVKVGRIQFAILGLVASGIVFFGKPFIYFWAGGGYEDAYYVALLLILPATITLIQNTGIEIQRALNRHQFRSIVYTIMALGNLALSIFLCQKYGAVGAAIGTAISLVVANGIIMNIYFHKKCYINILSFWKNILRMSLGLIIPIGCGVFINLFVDIYNIWFMLLSIAGYTIVYCVSMWFLGLNKYERGLIKKPMKKILQKVKSILLPKSQNKNLYWQIVRAIAIIAVVLIHCGSETSNITTFNGIYYLVARNLINFPVALFFFVSGLFTKYKTGGIFAFYKKKLPRLLIPYFVFGILYLIANLALGEKYTIWQAIVKVVTGQIATPFYYIVVLVLFVLITPLLNKCLCSKALSVLVLTISPVMSMSAYVLNDVCNLASILRYTPIWVSFYYLGMLLKKNPIKMSIKAPIALLPFAFAFQIVETIVLNNTTLEWLKYSQLKISGIFYSLLIILLIYAISHRNLNCKKCGFLVCIGDNSYGIYYIHYLLIAGINFALGIVGLPLPLPILRVAQLSVAIIGSLTIIVFIKIIFRAKWSKRLFGV